MAFVIAILAIWGLIGLGRVVRDPKMSYVDAFADLYAVDLTQCSTRLLQAAINRSRAYRYAGAAVVALAYAIVDGDAGFYSVLGAVAVGFAVGSLVDEITKPRPDTNSRAHAALERRTIRTFVERWVLALLCLTVVGVMISGAILLHLHDGVFSDPGIPRRRVVVGWMAWVAAVTGIGGYLVRRLAQLPTSAETPDVQAVLHALRMSAVLSVVGAQLLIVGVVGWRLGDAAMLNDGDESKLIQWGANVSTITAGFAIALGLPMSLRALPRGTRVTGAPRAVSGAR